MIRRSAVLLVGSAVLALLASCSSASAGPENSVGTAASDTAPSASVGADRDAWLARGGCRSITVTGSAASATAQDTPAGTLLTVTGRTAGGVPVALDLSQLDAMPQVECSIDDRQAEGHQVAFTGVLLSDALTAIGADASVTLHTRALNDYAVDLPVSDIRDLPVLLATRADGRQMTVAHYGPLRIVYPTTGYDLDPTVYDPRWIWQLSSIDVA